MLYFITGNTNKYQEVSSILDIPIEQLDIDLTEIQDMDPEKVIEAKLEEAHGLKDGAFIVEDTSLAFDCLNGLPGPLIKWFMKALDNDGLYNLVSKLGNSRATSYTIIGYSDEHSNLSYHRGEVHGTIVAPKGTNGFGWDPIFMPDNHEKTFAEMTSEEKNEMSTRKKAAEALRDHLGK